MKNRIRNVRYSPDVPIYLDVLLKQWGRRAWDADLGFYKKNPSCQQYVDKTTMTDYTFDNVEIVGLIITNHLADPLRLAIDARYRYRSPKPRTDRARARIASQSVSDYRKNFRQAISILAEKLDVAA